MTQNQTKELPKAATQTRADSIKDQSKNLHQAFTSKGRSINASPKMYI